ncbi:cytochrome P450 4d1-like [Anopheles cruzii]|uniref:cytochrome P450 4d1-like n=1 Tax=Anopheles cruzii TaxID=68878 RepID=UPI0022EC443E|nr:cytochrome P450 4d1-like [Anopheles cruzii]
MVCSEWWLVLVLTVAAALFVHRTFGEMLRYSGKLKGPKAYPIIGNGLLFLNKSPAEFLQIVGTLFEQYGKCYRVWLGTTLGVMMFDPKDIEVVLSNPKLITKSTEYDFMRPWLGEGLLTSSGRKWYTHRKVITPTFHFSILEEFLEIFDRQTTTFVEVLRPFAKSGESFDIFSQVALCTLDIICESAMGTTVNAQVQYNSTYVLAVKEITNLIQQRFYDFLIRHECFFRLSSNRRKQVKVLKVLHDYTDKVISERRRQLANTSHGKSAEESADLGIKKKMAFLDMLLQSTIDGQPLTDLEIREEVDTFMFEGHDTTTSAISFLLKCLAKNPDVQQKVYDEILDVFGTDRSKPVTMGMLHKLNYLDLVIKETLRMYPTVPMIGRKMLQTTVINGKIIPAGANVIIFPFFLGRSAEYYPTPEKFDPERFNMEKSAEKTNPYQYIPFSAGPRNCIGQKYAIVELKSIASKILQHYEILPTKEERDESFTSEIVLRPEHGTYIRLKARVYS